MSISKVWFVTRAASGFGLMTTQAALAQGDRVVATLRKPEALESLQAKYPADKLLVTKLDVTKLDEVETALAKAKAAFGRIDVVFNNAGWGAIGEIEGTPEDRARSMVETLFFGAANVSKTALKYFRENTPIGGRFLQISSQFGIIGFPGAGYYSAAKAALEAFSESLALEIDPAWNIKVTLIEPGPFRTKKLITLPPHPAYSNENLPVNLYRQLGDDVVIDGSPEKAAKQFLKLVALENPPLRFPIHRDAIACARIKAKNLLEAADTYESWSEDVYH
ncbi:hypothetical protein M413DRAFT_445669 [Hebeloma cylindrosporum]|uniref:NAD(P)-binding protein n=1 Tax=Hebeloma cylindrosporum TaxID=76867 RepID=A0A0C2XT88_HEBCY|nr:hypothetical protein M413DRAFT_445669 [Hebeloma cylindrosporum h7]